MFALRFSSFLLTAAAGFVNATAASAQSILSLDVITITAGKTSESAIDALAGVSYLSPEELEKLAASLPSDVFRTLPGVFASPLGNDKGAIVNIRGLQNFGRVAVTIDGARQDFSRNSHAGNGSFYLEPELLKSVTVVRGPAGNSYGSGAIGGVVAFETIDAEDVLRGQESWALSNKTGYESNGPGFFTTVRAANRFNDAFDVVGGFVYRDSDNYTNGEGQVVPNTAQRPVSGLVKATLRPADGHTVVLSGMHYDNQYLSSRSAGLPPAFPFFASLDDTHTTNSTVVGKWTYSKPEDNLFDFAGTLYWNETATDQTKIAGSNSGSSGSIGHQRHFNVQTTGVEAHNSSRTEGYGFAHTFTYGLDYFKDIADSHADVTSAGTFPTSTTSSGERAAYGGFFQWEGKHDNWLDLLTALRYDGFNLAGLDTVGNPVSLDGSRLSPKATIGITPGGGGLTFYGTYAEGYRAPSITETFIGGTHQNDFAWQPNPNLLPETARTFEAGINIKYNDLAFAGDAIRVKLGAFQTMVDDYIDVVCISGDCAPGGLPDVNQYQNVGLARLKGFEVEGTYDAGWGYLGFSGSIVDARKVSDGTQLNATTPGTKFGTTLGLRNAEWNVEYGVQWVYVGGTDSVLGGTDPYSLINLFAEWQINSSMALSLGVENVFDVAYTDPVSGWIVDPSVTGGFGEVTSNGRGRTFKIALSGRIGG